MAGCRNRDQRARPATWSGGSGATGSSVGDGPRPRCGLPTSQAPSGRRGCIRAGGRTAGPVSDPCPKPNEQKSGFALNPQNPGAAAACGSSRSRRACRSAAGGGHLRRRAWRGTCAPSPWPPPRCSSGHRWRPPGRRCARGPGWPARRCSRARRGCPGTLLAAICSPLPEPPSTTPREPVVSGHRLGRPQHEHRVVVLRRRSRAGRGWSPRGPRPPGSATSSPSSSYAAWSPPMWTRIRKVLSVEVGASVEDRAAVAGALELEEAGVPATSTQPSQSRPAASPLGAGVTTGPKNATPSTAMTGVPTSSPTRSMPARGWPAAASSTASLSASLGQRRPARPTSASAAAMTASKSFSPLEVDPGAHRGVERLDDLVAVLLRPRR